MKVKNFIPLTCFFLISLSLETIGQVINNSSNRKDPVGISSYKNGSLYIKLTYGRPKCHDRELLFGYKIPHRRLWRTGSREATEITITDSAKIAGELVAPGTYSLFTIPDTAVWTIVLNKDVGLEGLYKYKPENDLFRKEVPAYRSPKLFERMTFFFEKTQNGADLIFIWQFTSFRLPFEIH